MTDVTVSDVTATTEQLKLDVTDTPAVDAVEPIKTEEPQAVTESPAIVGETPQATSVPVPEDPKEVEKPAEAEKPSKGPGILAKLIAPFNKRKAKSPKRGKEPETPVVDEAPKLEEAPAAVTEAATETSKEAVEPVKEPETLAVETPAAEVPVAEVPVAESKEEKKDKIKFARRLSTRVGDMFKKKSEAPTTAKVDELPPKIEEPTPVAPLENPANDGAVLAESPAEPSEPVKSVEPAPAATPVVAAAA